MEAAVSDSSIVPSESNPPKLSHKKWRALQKKLKRKLRRQSLAKAREQNESSGPEEGGGSDVVNEAERQRQSQAHAAWLERERRALAEIEAKKIWEEKEKRRREEEDRKIKEEWEERQRVEKEEEEKRKAREAERKERHEKLLKEATANENTDGDWHNPLAPQVNVSGKVQERPHCPFFAKVGACRFGDRCSRFHDIPEVSQTLLFPNMYSQFQLDQGLFDEYDSDLVLEYEDSEIYQHFKDFYYDALPEFKNAGKVIQFKVCCNYEPHLRGNVYVQYESENEAVVAFSQLNGRWYGGKQLSCEFSNIVKWKNAICGLFHQKRCPKGKNCNFLHVFRNPGNEFRDADFDYENLRKVTESRSRRSHGEYSQRSRRSRSPSRHRSRHRTRSRSRDRYSRPRSRDRSRRSSQRPRSRSGSRARHRRSRSRESTRGRDRESSHREDKESSHGEGRESSRDEDRESSRGEDRKRSRRSSSVSSHKPKQTEANPWDEDTPPHPYADTSEEEQESAHYTDTQPVVDTVIVNKPNTELNQKRRRSSSGESDEDETSLRNKLLNQIMGKENGKSHKAKKKKTKKHKHKKHKSKDLELKTGDKT